MNSLRLVTKNVFSGGVSATLSAISCAQVVEIATLVVPNQSQ